MVFDPLRDEAPFLALAASKRSRIRHVVDSHTHADHVSGARRLAEAAGAELVLPERAEIAYPARRLADGETLAIGEVELVAWPAPGHRPEQIALLVIDRSRGEEPWCLLSADFVLVGDLARPDLGQGGAEGAAILFDETLPRFRALPDFVEIYPGHVAGST